MIDWLIDWSLVYVIFYFIFHFFPACSRSFLFQLFSVAFLKLLSTAVANTYPWGDPEGEAPTWLLETCAIGLCDTETPEPPDDVPAVMPGAKLPSQKAKKKTSKQLDGDSIDGGDGDDDAEETPLIKRQQPRQLSAGNAVTPATGGGGGGNLPSRNGPTPTIGLGDGSNITNKVGKENGVGKGKKSDLHGACQCFLYRFTKIFF